MEKTSTPTTPGAGGGIVDPRDAIESVFNFIRLKPKYVLDANLTKCFDRISQIGLQLHPVLDNALYHQLARWARYRHPRKSGKWCYHRYWRKVNKRIRFSDGESVLSFHQTTVVSRFVKMQGNRSPYDGDWVYWSTRLGRDPSKPRRVTRLLKRQRGCCALCGLRFTTEDVIEVHHYDKNHNNNVFDNLRLTHGHCHDIVHGKGYL